MILPHCRQEQRAWQRHNLPVFSLDEVGRGALAGPVCACAFVIRKPLKIKGKIPKLIRDSKQLSPSQRQKMYTWIKDSPQYAYATAFTPAKAIDKVNIRQANFRAMRQAIEKLSQKTGYRKFVLFVDGNDPIPGLKQIQYCFIKGDARIFSIACASIIAKVTRDKRMRQLAKLHPQYAFEIHKGYGTRLHYRAIKKHGVS